jgi:hypothetical protein
VGGCYDNKQEDNLNLCEEFPSSFSLDKKKLKFLLTSVAGTNVGTVSK